MIIGRVGRTLSHCIYRPLHLVFSLVCLCKRFFLSHLVAFVSPYRSKHMVALADALRKAELHKNDLDLELQLLEEAAELVIDEEQEELIKKGKQEGRKEQTKEYEEEDESSSSSTEEEEQDSSSSEEEEEHGSCVPKREEEEEQKGGLTICPCPQELEHGASLIQELGERLEEELRIREDVPQIAVPSSSRARGAEGEVEGLRQSDDSQLPEALDRLKITNAASDTAPLAHRQRNVRILNPEGLDSDDEDEPNQ